MDLYDQASPDESGDSPAPEKESEDTDSTGETSLVPKSALDGKPVEPGKECKFRVVHVYEDEVEFEYVKHSEEKGESTMDKADAAIDAMAAPTGAEE